MIAETSAQRQGKWRGERLTYHGLVLKNDGTVAVGFRQQRTIAHPHERGKKFTGAATTNSTPCFYRVRSP